ncbi:hypothetical protein AAH678_04820 [Sodalis endosymbiont of Spalangia cameroni]|uniref:hypothetical protein n=1 Tax=Sodalis praecaptivus TaxID=1239307 RepID=UPI0031F76E1E
MWGAEYGVLGAEGWVWGAECGVLGAEGWGYRLSCRDGGRHDAKVLLESPCRDAVIPDAECRERASLNARPKRWRMKRLPAVVKRRAFVAVLWRLPGDLS